MLMDRLPLWLRGEEATYSARDAGSIPGSGRSPGEGNVNPLQYSCLKNPMGPEGLVGEGGGRGDLDGKYM